MNLGLNKSCGMYLIEKDDVRHSDIVSYNFILAFLISFEIWN